MLPESFYTRERRGIRRRKIDIIKPFFLIRENRSERSIHYTSFIYEVFRQHS